MALEHAQPGVHRDSLRQGGQYGELKDTGYGQ